MRSTQSLQNGGFTVKQRSSWGTVGLKSALSWSRLREGTRALYRNILLERQNASPSPSLFKVSFSPSNDSLHQRNGRHPEERPCSESHCLQKRCWKAPAREMSVSQLLSTHLWTCMGAACKHAFSIAWQSFVSRALSRVA